MLFLPLAMLVTEMVCRKTGGEQTSILRTELTCPKFSIYGKHLIANEECQEVVNIVFKALGIKMCSQWV